MAVKRHNVHFDITARNEASGPLAAVENSLKVVNSAAVGLSRAFQGLVIAGGAITWGREWGRAAMEAEQASNRLTAVLKATGHSAGLAKSQLDDMADALSESTQFDDESLRNAQAQLLKFGNIHANTFERTLKLSADLAAFMGTDVTSAAAAVGKAVSSPTEGLMALERQIGKLDPVTKAHIEQLMEQNRLYEAQGAVLDALQSRIGGTADKLNSGLTKAVNDAKKSWDELNEAIGKAGAPAAISGLQGVSGELKRWKSIIEDGTWWEKFVAVLAAQSPLARVMGIKPGLSKNQATMPPAPTPTSEITGVMTYEEAIAGEPSSDKDLPALMKRWEQEKERAKRELEQYREQMRKLDEKSSTEYLLAQEKAIEARDDLIRATVELERAERKRLELLGQRSAEEDLLGQERRREEQDEIQRRSALEARAADEKKLEQETKKAESAARDLGLTFSSAFEDAIVGGKELRDVLQGLAQDVLRIAIRKSVTEPMAANLSGLFKGMFSGGGGAAGGEADYWGNADFSGGFASGGFIPPGKWGMTGEEGPEPVFGGNTGVTVLPNDALGGGTVVVNQTIQLSTGVSATVRSELMAMMPQIKAAAVDGVAEARRRGGSFAKAFGA